MKLDVRPTNHCKDLEIDDSILITECFLLVAKKKSVFYNTDSQKIYFTCYQKSASSWNFFILCNQYLSQFTSIYLQ